MAMPHVLDPIGAVDAETAWEAVVARDAAFDGRFVYAVRTTGVYCRPSCPSRQAKRVNVSFYADPDAAEQGGFRPCRRCHPRNGDGPTAGAARIERARQLIEQAGDARLTLHQLAAKIGMSPFHFQRTFKRIVGISPSEYMRARRATRLRTALRAESTVSRATYEAGFGSGSRVYEGAPATLGMTPAAYRRGGAGQEIRYTTIASPHGRLLVAVTDRGICAVTLGDSDKVLVAGLAREYPGAHLTRVDEGADGLFTDLVERVAHGAEASELPLDVQGTTFQWRVWRELQRIPEGETRTYSEIAKRIGRPTAARAVARACASNRVALVVPCHRVIREDGALGGYRWGLERKERILSLERAASGARSPAPRSR